MIFIQLKILFLLLPNCRSFFPLAHSWWSWNYNRFYLENGSRLFIYFRGFLCYICISNGSMFIGRLPWNRNSLSRGKMTVIKIRFRFPRWLGCGCIEFYKYIASISLYYSSSTSTFIHSSLLTCYFHLFFNSFTFHFIIWLYCEAYKIWSQITRRVEKDSNWNLTIISRRSKHKEMELTPYCQQLLYPPFPLAQTSRTRSYSTYDTITTETRNCLLLS